MNKQEILANFSLPQAFLNQNVIVEFRGEDANLTGRILQHTEFWVLVEGKLGFYLIPWTAICNLRINKDVKQIEKEKEA